MMDKRIKQGLSQFHLFYPRQYFVIFYLLLIIFVGGCALTDHVDIEKESRSQEEPKQEEPKQEEPKQEEPKQEEPKQEEPKQEEPKQEEPKQEEPKQNILLENIQISMKAGEKLEENTNSIIKYTQYIDPVITITGNIKNSGDVVINSVEILFQFYVLWPGEASMSERNNNKKPFCFKTVYLNFKSNSLNPKSNKRFNKILECESFKSISGTLNNFEYEYDIMRFN